MPSGAVLRNPTTAQLYTDLGILTCDPRITRDVVTLFNELTGLTHERHYDQLIIAPYDLRTTPSDIPSAPGVDVPDMTDSEALDTIQYHVFPNLVCWAGWGSFLVYRFRPDGAGEQPPRVLSLLSVFRRRVGPGKIESVRIVEDPASGPRILPVSVHAFLFREGSRKNPRQGAHPLVRRMFHDNPSWSRGDASFLL